jgi:hypothetical protein
MGSPEKLAIVDQFAALTSRLSGRQGGADVPVCRSTWETGRGKRAETEQGGAMKLDLRESDPQFRVVMVVPDGSTAVAEYGTVEIEGNTMNALQAYHVDEAGALLYESAMFGQPEFHLLVTATIGGEAYYFEDSKGPSYTREQVEAMLEACRSASDAEA